MAFSTVSTRGFSGRGGALASGLVTSLNSSDVHLNSNFGGSPRSASAVSSAAVPMTACPEGYAGKLGDAFGKSASILEVGLPRGVQPAMGSVSGSALPSRTPTTGRQKRHLYFSFHACTRSHRSWHPLLTRLAAGLPACPAGMLRAGGVREGAACVWCDCAAAACVLHLNYGQRLSVTMQHNVSESEATKRCACRSAGARAPPWGSAAGTQGAPGWTRQPSRR